MPAGKGRYTIGRKGSHGCKGYPVVGGEGKVHGCHDTVESARQQQSAIYAAQARESEKVWKGSAFDPSSDVENCCPETTIEKADGYTPTEGMKTAARRALKWKEEGKANGAGTPVGWGRASDIVAGRSMSLDTVKRMYSFFSRHEVDKKGKGFYDGPEFPSNGRIMWDAWGGDAGFTWSKNIVEREAKKMWEGSAFDTSFAKRDYSSDARQRMAESGAAMPDGSFPIANTQDLRNAIQSVGRASDYDAARRHIVRRARALGLTEMLPEEWKD